MMLKMRVASAWVKRVIYLPSLMTIFVLSLATFQPASVFGFTFDYAVGGHSVSILSNSNTYTWYENTPADSAPKSFSFSGRGTVLDHQPSTGTVNLGALDNASAVSANATFGTMGVKAEAVDPSGTYPAAVQTAAASVQMGGAFIISGPDATLDLKVLTHLDGIINVTLQDGISNESIISMEMDAASQDYRPGNYWSSSAGWWITPISASNSGEEFQYKNPGLYFNDELLSDSADGSYVFDNYDVTLTLSGVKTNKMFNLDLFLKADINGPAMGGTVGDKLDFFSTYSMGFAGNNPEQWFELPAGYSIMAASEVPVTTPEPATMLLFSLGLLGLAGVRRKLKK